jgi:hypothetical protein
MTLHWIIKLIPFSHHSARSRFACIPHQDVPARPSIFSMNGQEHFRLPSAIHLRHTSNIKPSPHL